MNNKKRICILLIFCAFIVASIVISLVKTEGLIEDAYENDLRVESRMIANAIDNSILRPLTVAETMSKDYILRQILDSETLEESNSHEKIAAEYLKSIKEGFGYSMVFAVNDKYGTYYTYDGITKHIDAVNNSSDEWYKLFLNRKGDKIYKLDVDVDEVNDWDLSVFINTEVRSSEGEYVGCCGVGVAMTELQREIERFERIYDVKIDLINEDGLIQIDSDAQRIEREYLKIDNLRDFTDGECYYEKGSGNGRTIMYIDSMEWFLVVESLTAVERSAISLIVPNLICGGVGVLAIAIYLYYFAEDKSRKA